MNEKLFKNTCLETLEEVVKSQIPHTVSSAFMWMATPEGHEYWSKVSVTEEFTEEALAKLKGYINEYKVMALTMS